MPRPKWRSASRPRRARWTSGDYPAGEPLSVGVDVEMAHYMTVDKPQAIVLFEVVKGTATGSTPDIGTVKSAEPEN